MREYRGERDEEHETTVTVNGAPLNGRHKLRNHSPCGFEWGYSGSGPAQLALAITRDHLEHHVEQMAVLHETLAIAADPCEDPADLVALLLYQGVKVKLIAPIKLDSWRLTSVDVQSTLEELAAARMAAARVRA